MDLCQAEARISARPVSTWNELLDRLRVRQLSAPRRILYVDPDTDSARQFQVAARRRNATVDCATDAVEAFSYCVEYAYDTVVLCTSQGMAERLVEPVRALQTSAAVILLRPSDSPLCLIPPDDPGIVGMLPKPWTTQQIDGVLQRAFALSDTRLEWNSSVRNALPVSVQALFVGPDHALPLVENYLKQTPTGSPVVLHSVRSLHEAEAFIDTQPIDAIVTELTLPDARGLDCVVALGEGPRAKPLVVIGAQRDEPLVVQLLRHGAHEFVTHDAIAAGRLPEAVSNALDRHRATERVAHLAHHDPLTGLPNRALFEQRLRASLSRAKRKSELLAVLYIDLDHFKPINDRLGHDVGDRVLQVIGKRLAACVREYDTAARLGGDEFAVVLNCLEREEEAFAVAERINASLSTPIPLEANQLRVTASVGVALYPGREQTVDELLKAADQSMYRVKRSGRNHVSRNRPHLHLVP